MDVETWAGCNDSLRLKISQVQEIQIRCAVSVLSPRTSVFTPGLPGPGSEIGRRMEWLHKEKTERSGLWWFPGALKKRDMFPVLCAAVDLVRKGSYHTACRSRVIPRVLVRMNTGEAPLSGHEPESGAGHC